MERCYCCGTFFDPDYLDRFRVCVFCYIQCPEFASLGFGLMCNRGDVSISVKERGDSNGKEY